MFEAILEALPANWRAPVQLVLGLIAWIPEWQDQLIELVWWTGDTPIAVFGSRVLFLLPALLLIVAMWSTMTSVYTLPFRSGRSEYIRTIMMTWWDAGRSIWLFWAGIGRLLIVLAGWFWGLLKLGFSLIGRFFRGLINSPLDALDWTTRRYFKPGMPWLAFLLLLGWSALEASVFTFTLRPTLSGVLWDLTGTQPNPFFMTPLLFLFLFFLIAGSFASIQVLTEAINDRKIKEIIQMVAVEFFVMFFEVVFLYRELIAAVTPWIAQQTNGEVRLGLWSTLALASFGWMGIRGMTWFLFGRYGTPAVLAILSRQTLTVDAPEGAAASGEAAPRSTEPRVTPWNEVVAVFKAEREWFEKKGNHLLELAVLPVLQLLAAAINFCLIVVASRPAFRLPFESLNEAMQRLPSAQSLSRRSSKGVPAAEPAREVQHG